MPWYPPPAPWGAELFLLSQPPAPHSSAGGIQPRPHSPHARLWHVWAVSALRASAFAAPARSNGGGGTARGWWGAAIGLPPPLPPPSFLLLPPPPPLPPPHALRLPSCRSPGLIVNRWQRQRLRLDAALPAAQRSARPGWSASPGTPRPLQAQGEPRTGVGLAPIGTLQGAHGGCGLRSFGAAAAEANDSKGERGGGMGKRCLRDRASLPGCEVVE